MLKINLLNVPKYFIHQIKCLKKGKGKKHMPIYFFILYKITYTKYIQNNIQNNIKTKAGGG